MSGEGAPALEVTGLVKHFPVGGRIVGGAGVVHAVEDVSFSLAEGELLGLVGESGSGKSTVANCVLRLVEPTAGTIRLLGTDITLSFATQVPAASSKRAHDLSRPLFVPQPAPDDRADRR